MCTHDSYKTGLFVTWTARVVCATSLVAIIAILGGCSHNLDLSSKGSLTKDDPPKTEPITN